MTGDADALWDAERRFWDASAAGDTIFFDEHLSDDAVLVFPAPTGILDREQCIQAVSAGGTNAVEFRFEEPSLDWLTDDACLLVYRAVARWQGSPGDTVDLRSSLYIRRAGLWQLRFHQVTSA